MPKSGMSTVPWGPPHLQRRKMAEADAASQQKQALADLLKKADATEVVKMVCDIAQSAMAKAVADAKEVSQLREQVEALQAELVVDKAQGKKSNPSVVTTSGLISFLASMADESTARFVFVDATSIIYALQELAEKKKMESKKISFGKFLDWFGRDDGTTFIVYGTSMSDTCINAWLDAGAHVIPCATAQSDNPIQLRRSDVLMTLMTNIAGCNPNLDTFTVITADKFAIPALMAGVGSSDCVELFTWTDVLPKEFDAIKGEGGVAIYDLGLEMDTFTFTPKKNYYS